MNIRRSTLIGTAVAMALFGRTGDANSQGTTASGQGQDDVLEEIVVRGIRASLRQSLETKRNSVGVVDAITAEDVGKFPDKNLAEALQRVPGVVVNREFGEGERINLRGTGANLTRTLINGHALATADWFILDQLQTTRSFNYLMLPSDIIGQVAVHKTPQADFEEGGVGGIVDVITRNPLDLDSMTILGSIQAGHTDLADSTDPQATGLFSWKNADSTLGILGAAVYQERNIRRDGVEVLGYSDLDTDPGPAVNNLRFPSLIGSALFEQERVRTGGNVGVQFRPSDDVDVNVTALYSKFDADNINQNFLAWGSRAIGNGGTLTNATIVGDTAVAGRISSLNGGTQDFGVVYDAIDRFATAETRNVDVDTNFRLNGDWTLHLKLGYTDAEGNTDSQPFVEFGAPAAWDFDLRGRAPQVSYVNVNPSDPTDLQFIFSSLHQILNEDSETYAYADLEKGLDVGVFNAIKFGVKHTDHDRDLRFNATTYGGFHVPINTTPAATFAGPPTPSDFLSSIASPGTLTSYWQVNQDAVEQILFANLASGPPRIVYPQQTFAVAEKSYAGYVMGRMAGEGWRGNLGVRLVRTEQTSSGAVVSPNGSIQNAFGNFDPITVERSYNDVLPSVNLAFDVADDMVLRFAAARTMARPDFTDVAPRATLNPGALSGQSGNPELDPYRADQFDVSFEWYRDENTAYALALYYKDIQSFITDSPVTRFFNVQSATSPNLACTPVSANVFNCPFLINERTNGGGGRLQGAELSVTQPLGGGFGVTGNYTYSDAGANNGDPIPGNSENTFNVATYFENSRVSARVAYTYRSEFFVAFDRTTQLNQAALESVDASVVVNLTDSFALTFDGVNLTNEKIEQFAGEEFRPRAVYDNGRVYFAGVRVRF
ncbi:MAG: TonB-dependent receptor [Gammaproteobacteria bacterium]